MSANRAGEGMRRFMLRSGLEGAACDDGEANISALLGVLGDWCADVPPLGKENWSTPMGMAAASANGMNGANGLADADDDAAIVSGGLIAPLLPLPCGAGSMAA